MTFAGLIGNPDGNDSLGAMFAAIASSGLPKALDSNKALRKVIEANKVATMGVAANLAASVDLQSIMARFTLAPDTLAMMESISRFNLRLTEQMAPLVDATAIHRMLSDSTLSKLASEATKLAASGVAIQLAAESLAIPKDTWLAGHVAANMAHLVDSLRWDRFHINTAAQVAGIISSIDFASIHAALTDRETEYVDQSPSDTQAVLISALLALTLLLVLVQAFLEYNNARGTNIADTHQWEAIISLYAMYDLPMRAYRKSRKALGPGSDERPA